VKMVFSVFVKDDLLVHQTTMILGPMNDTCRLIEIRNSCDICPSVPYVSPLFCVGTF